MKDDKWQVFQRLETALRLREEAEYTRNMARYVWEQTIAAVIVECTDAIVDAGVAAEMVATIQTINTRASLDKRCVDAYTTYLELARQHTHAEDTVTLIQAEISLWEKGKATPDATK